MTHTFKVLLWILVLVVVGGYEMYEHRFLHDLLIVYKCNYV